MADDAREGGNSPKSGDGEPADSVLVASRVDPRLLELLVCPLTKTRLEYDSARQELVSRAAGLAYPIRNGVPLMTEDAARRLDDDAAKA